MVPTAFPGADAAGDTDEVSSPPAPADRYLLPQLRADLEREMVFVGGPRQVGKTSLARRLLSDAAAEMNYDVAAHRQAILARQLPAATCGSSTRSISTGAGATI